MYNLCANNRRIDCPICFGIPVKSCVLKLLLNYYRCESEHPPPSTGIRVSQSVRQREGEPPRKLSRGKYFINYTGNFLNSAPTFPPFAPLLTQQSSSCSCCTVNHSTPLASERYNISTSSGHGTNEAAEMERTALPCRPSEYNNFYFLHEKKARDQGEVKSVSNQENNSTTLRTALRCMLDAQPRSRGSRSGGSFINVL